MEEEKRELAISILKEAIKRIENEECDEEEIDIILNVLGTLQDTTEPEEGEECYTKEQVDEFITTVMMRGIAMTCVLGDLLGQE